MKHDDIINKILDDHPQFSSNAINLIVESYRSYVATPDAVERVAEAMYRSRGASHGNVESCKIHSPDLWRSYIVDAKAAIAAMGGAAAQLTDATADASEVRRSVGRTMEETPPASDTALEQELFLKLRDACSDGWSGDASCLSAAEALDVFRPYLRTTEPSGVVFNKTIMTGTCCENGTFESPHECMKQKPTEQFHLNVVLPNCPHCHKIASGKGHSTLGGEFYHCICGNKWDVPFPSSTQHEYSAEDALHEVLRGMGISGVPDKQESISFKKVESALLPVIKTMWSSPEAEAWSIYKALIENDIIKAQEDK